MCFTVDPKIHWKNGEYFKVMASRSEAGRVFYRSPMYPSGRWLEVGDILEADGGPYTREGESSRGVYVFASKADARECCKRLSNLLHVVVLVVYAEGFRVGSAGEATFDRVYLVGEVTPARGPLITGAVA